MAGPAAKEVAMSDLQLLSQLQDEDLAIEAKIVSLQEIESSLGETGDLLAARSQVESLRELLHQQEQRLRELELDVDDLNEHVAAEEKKLYGGTVRNPKELEGLQRDLNQRRAKKNQIEDRELEVMADVEVTQAELQLAQEELTRTRAAWEEHQRELSTRQAKISRELETLRGTRSQLAASVEPANISLYERLRREKRGRAVSRVERSTCMGCRIALPMGVVQHARAGRDFVYCPSCGRILYVH
jgi:predicted  nucleic acid-binding Zn-ribbon protein